MKRQRERGSAMLVTMIIITALIAGSAVLVGMQLSTNKSSDMTRNGLSSLYCAEAGLAAARPYVVSNYALWNTALAAGAVQPSWLGSAIFSHDLDGDGSDDFTVWIKDDDDDANYQSDTNSQIFIVSRCTKYGDNPHTVEELIKYTPVAKPYGAQEGGCNGRGNANGC